MPRFSSRRALFLSALSGALPAQSNVLPGLDAQLTLIEDARYFGRRGPAYPNGEIAMAYAYYLCNNGTVQIPWQGPDNGPAPMRTIHPMWAFMVVRESGGRLVQINDDRSYVKHASSAANASGCASRCQNSHSSAILGVSCSDAYSQTTNANRFYLGPADEIDPWLGTWDPIHSLFDRGDPDVGPPANADGVRSFNGVVTDPVKNRIALRESDLLVPGQFHYFMHTLVQGEDADNRLDNIGHRQMTPAWNGSNWTFTDVAPFANGPVLAAWSGASVSMARNGDDDGHLFVAVKVTGPQNGLWHYEYAVHNLDNRRGAATLRIPVCPSTVVSGTGFRDIDANPLDDWTWSRAGNELICQAQTNALRWNQLFNFWFDCSTAPVAGTVELDQALPGPGALSIGVGTQVPCGAAAVSVIGAGCGNPSPSLAAVGMPVIGDPSFELVLTTSPNAPLFLFTSPLSASTQYGGGCVQYFDTASSMSYGFLVADPNGVVHAPVPVPNRPELDGLELHWQAAQLVAGGPVLNILTLSNGLKTIVGCH